MHEEFTMHFKRGDAQVYQLDSTVLKEFGDGGRIKRLTELSTRPRPGTEGWVIPTSGKRLSTAQLIALAFVRVAQLQFERIVEIKETEVPIFEDTKVSDIATRFRNVRAESTKPDSNENHHARWVQKIFPLPVDEKDKKLLSKWFSVESTGTGCVVKCCLAALPPTNVHIFINGESVSEAELDRLETFLSFKLSAGLPYHLYADGTVFAGRPPSIQPGFWLEQESEWLEAESAYDSGKSILTVIGKTASAKTIFASYWLRRLTGNGKKRQRFVFSWSFSRQFMEHFVAMPLDPFFHELALMLKVEFPSTAPPVEQAKVVLAALKEKPTLLFLDGIEATFHVPPEGDASSDRAEIPTALARLLRGMSELPGNFVIATSQRDFVPLFKLPKNACHCIQLEPISIEAVQTTTTQYAHELASSAEHKSNESENQKISSGKSQRSAADADLRRILMCVSGCQSEKELDAWIAQKSKEFAPPEGYLLTFTAPPYNKQQMEMLNVFLRSIHEKLEEILLHIVCACHKPIDEKILLSVAADLPIEKLYGHKNKPSAEQWSDALAELVSTHALEQGGSQLTYSVHPAKRRVIAGALKRQKTLTWLAINKGLADQFMDQAKGKEYPETRAELAPLIDAAIHLAQAGEKRYAYEEIGYRRLSRGLKGHAIVVLGDYTSARSINHALLGDMEVDAVSDLPKEAEAMCIHANALCLRFLDDLEGAFREERKAWIRAKLTENPNAILPIGFNMLRLSHIFGALSEVKEVESTIRGIVIRKKIRFWLRDVLAADDIVDGASALSSMLALTMIYRGDWKWLANRVLNSGIKDCRNNKGNFRFLMPSYGRPWHALTLLEMGDWQTCEKAMAVGEWGSETVRYQQTGFFEWLAAKTFLAKAQYSTGAERAEALTKASNSAHEAVFAARRREYRWWLTVSQLTQGQIFAEASQLEAARGCVDEALDRSQANSFQLLTVDALLEHARLAQKVKHAADCQHSAREALTLSRKLGYGLRTKALTGLLEAAR